MVQVSLVEYIGKQLNAGLNIEQVKEHLKEQGYDPREVDSSAQYAHNLKNNPQLAQNQRIEQLSVYVEQQLKAGYQISQIKQYLINSNYPYHEVDSAINLIQQPKKEEHHVLIAAIFIVVLMGGAILAITLMNLHLFAVQQELPGEKQLLDVKAKKLTTAPIPGESLDFQLDVFNLGAEKRYDIILEYKIIDRSTEEEIAGQKETFALETSTSKILSIDIPANSAPGKYLLEIDASYEDQVAKAGFIFDVYAAEAVAEITPELPDEDVDLPELPTKIIEQIDNLSKQGIPVPVDEPAENVSIEPAVVMPDLPEVAPSQFAGMTKQQKLDLIKRTSLIDPAKAAAQCFTFTYTSYERDCIIEVAKFKKDASICVYLNNTDLQDACYMQLLIDDSALVSCDKIQNSQLSNSCGLLKQSQQLQQQYTMQNPFG